MDATTIKVSVIVPTYADADQLKLCLQALENQTLPKPAYEVIVVNNKVGDNLHPLVNEFGQVKLAEESKSGSYAARNKGLSLANGEIIAFTDADCIPEPDWLEKGIARLTTTENCGLVAGKIQLFYQDPSSPNDCELYDQVFAFPQQSFLEKDHYGATANVFTYRHVIDNVGNFDADLKSGGDFHWGQKVFAAGYAMVYADEVQINHPARNSMEELRKKLKRIVKGHYNLIKEERELRETAYTPMRFYGGLLADVLLPFRSVPSILTTNRLTSLPQRLVVIRMSIWMRYLKAYERLSQIFS